jgi:LmbE family N-acetylglucosaminyl deacetylase
MLDKAKTFLRRHVRAFRRAVQYPVLVPGHTPTDAGVQTVDGATRAVAPDLAQALRLCDGTRTSKQVTKQARIGATDLIRAHEDGLVLIWRSPVPAAAPAAMGHAPHSIILSPHLDDAALSCGGRMLGDQSVLVVDVFNKSAWWRFPHTVADADRIQACRNVEEAMISRLSGAVIKMLDLPEALLRGHAMADLFTATPGARDAEVTARIQDAVATLAREYPLAHWFLPLAIGGHIDHLIVRDAATKALAGAQVKPTHLHFYEDLPYAAKLGPEADFATHIPGRTLREESLDIEEQLPWKLELLRAYWSQFRLGEFAELGRYARAVGGSEAAEITWTPNGDPS